MPSHSRVPLARGRRTCISTNTKAGTSIIISARTSISISMNISISTSISISISTSISISIITSTSISISTSTSTSISTCREYGPRTSEARVRTRTNGSSASCLPNESEH